MREAQESCQRSNEFSKSHKLVFTKSGSKSDKAVLAAVRLLFIPLNIIVGTRERNARLFCSAIT
jgi:hypothetical protein